MSLGTRPAPSAGCTESALSTRPTTGAGVTAAIVLGALPAALLGLDLAWVVVSFGLAVLTASALLPRRAVRALALVDHPTSLAPTAGRAVPFALEFEALRSARGVTASVLDPEGAPRDGEGAARVELGSLPAGGRVAGTALGRFATRGRRTSFAVRLTSGYPFGLFVARRIIAVPAELTVGPRPASRPERRLVRLVRALGDDGAHELRPAPHGTRRDLPDGQRIARVLPPAREIAWAPTLRLGRTVVHERNAAPRPERIDVVLVRGVRGAGRSGLVQSDAAFEAAVRTAAWVLGELGRRGHRAGLAFSDHDPDAPPHEHAARAGRRWIGAAVLRERLSLVERTTRATHDDGGERSTAPVRTGSAGATLIVLAAAPLALRAAERSGITVQPGEFVVLVGPDERTWTSGEGRASGWGGERSLVARR